MRLFTNSGISDISKIYDVAADTALYGPVCFEYDPNHEGYGCISRPTIINYLKSQGIEVDAVITPADPGYDKGLGAAFELLEDAYNEAFDFARGKSKVKLERKDLEKRPGPYLFKLAEEELKLDTYSAEEKRAEAKANTYKYYLNNNPVDGVVYFENEQCCIDTVESQHRLYNQMLLVESLMDSNEVFNESFTRVEKEEEKEKEKDREEDEKTNEFKKSPHQIHLVTVLVANSETKEDYINNIHSNKVLIEAQFRKVIQKTSWNFLLLSYQYKKEILENLLETIKKAAESIDYMNDEYDENNTEALTVKLVINEWLDQSSGYGEIIKANKPINPTESNEDEKEEEINESKNEENKPTIKSFTNKELLSHHRNMLLFRDRPTTKTDTEKFIDNIIKDYGHLKLR